MPLPYRSFPHHKSCMLSVVNWRQPIRIAAGIVLCAVPAHLHAQQSLSLQDAIRIGLAQNPAARSSNDRIAVQRAQIVQARLRPNPRLYLQSEDLRPWDSNFSFADNTEDYGYVQQSVETFGKRRRRVESAESGLRKTEATHALELRQIAGGIATAYWQLAAARAEQVEWQRQLADFDRIVQYQSDRLQAGAAAGVDLLRTRVERDRVALSAAQAERMADNAAISFSREIGFPDARSVPLSDSLEQEYPVAEVPLAEAIESRPDVQASREAWNQAKDDLRLQHANALPNFDLLAGYKRNSGADTLYGAMQFDLPIFNRNQGGIATAKANVQLAQDDLSYARLLASSEIAMALNDYKRDETLVRSTLPGMDDRAGENERIVAEAYRSGGEDLLRYLDAERVLLETRVLAIQNWAEYQRAVTALKLAYGEEP